MKKLVELYWILIVIITLSLLIIHTFPIVSIDIVVDNTTIWLIVILIIIPLIPKLRKIKWRDIEAEISSDEIKKVKNAVEKLEKVEPKYPLPFDERAIRGYDEKEAQNLSIYLMELVESDTTLAFATLRAELERVIRCMFLEINKIKKVDFATTGVFGMISFLQDNTSIKKEILENSYNIIATSNKILHGGKIKHKDAYSLVKSGNKILNYLHGYLHYISSESYFAETIKKKKK